MGMLNDAALQVTVSPLNSNDARTRPKAKPQSGGWEKTLKLGLLAVVIVFLINLCALAVSYGQLRVSSGLAPLYTGSCTQTKRLLAFLHLFINILSSILLAASNYCMQCLSAPTRLEVDKSHARKRWLDLGVQSVRNLRSIAPSKLLLYSLLALSSLPLHLL